MKPDTLTGFYEERLPGYLDRLHRMVEINSFTFNPEGVDELARLTAKIFADLGFQMESVPSTNPEFGSHLVLTRPGSGAETIGLVSHLDTVFPPEEELANDFRWQPAGEKIYGPGTVDIKGGTMLIYMLLDALKSFAPEKFEAVNWIILLNSSEEMLSMDFGDLCLVHLAGAKACLVFEGGFYKDGNFKMVEARKGRATYKISVSGKASHAGVAHEKGANAVVQIAKTVAAIAAMTDYDKKITFNVGMVSGGTVVNRVPHYAEAVGEMRVFEPAIFEEGIAALEAMAGPGEIASDDGYPCTLAVEIGEQTGPWPPNSETDALLQLWEAAADELGYNVARESRGGLSDGNQTWHAIPTLDGLGPGGGNAHASESSPDGSKEPEYIFVPSIVPKAVLNYFAVLKLIE